MNKPKTQEIILQHPLWGFDPQNYQIYREEYKLVYKQKKLINEFIRLSESNIKLSDEEIIWDDTGYWSFIDENSLYIGSGEIELYNSIKNILSGKLVYCLSYRDAIIFLKCKILKGRIDPEVIIDIYSTSAFLPFVEVLDPFRKTIQEIGEYQLNNHGKINFENIFINCKSNVNFNISYLSCQLKNKKNIMIPHAVIPKGRWIGQVVVPNDFKPFPLKAIDSLEYIVGQFPGGCMKSDFFRSGIFYYRCSIGVFSDVIVLDGCFHFDLNDKMKKITVQNNSGIDKGFLDYFTQ